MNNPYTVKFDGDVPATLRRIATSHAARVAEVTGKGIQYEDMYDCSYRAGWKSGSDPMGALHSENGATVQELACRIRSAMQCDCEDCTNERTQAAR